MTAAGSDDAGIGASVNSALRQVAGAIAVAVLGSVLSATYARDLRPALAVLPGREAAEARASITQAAEVASRLPSGGSALRIAAGTAFLHGMSAVMLICAGVATLAALTSLRYLPGRTAPRDLASPQGAAAGGAASPQGVAAGGAASAEGAAAAAPDTGTRR
jgi:hypothetical protein